MNRRNFLRAVTGCAVAVAAVPAVVGAPRLSYSVDWERRPGSISIITRIDLETKTVYFEHINPTPEEYRRLFSMVNDVKPMYISYVKNPERYNSTIPS